MVSMSPWRTAASAHCSAMLASTSMPVFSQTIRGSGIGRQSTNSMRMK